MNIIFDWETEGYLGVSSRPIRRRKKYAGYIRHEILQDNQIEESGK